MAGSHSARSAGSENVVMVWWVLTDSCVAGGQIRGDTCKKNGGQTGGFKGRLICRLLLHCYRVTFLPDTDCLNPGGKCD